MHSSRKAFSLLELSIVMAIIGLVAGGIMVGTEMMRSAEIRNIVTDANRYRSAVQQFKTLYRYLPGDMPNATQYWGKDTTNCTTNSGAAGLPGTCNGNGNGIVEYSTLPNAPGEAFAFWQQLALGALIEGTYSGLAGNSPIAPGLDYAFGVNSPLSKIQGVGWGGAYVDNQVGTYPGMFRRDYRNWLTIGSLSADTTYADSPFLSTQEAFSLDQKLDDGLPGSGSINMAMDANGTMGSSCSNATSGTDYGASYKLANDAKNQCALLFKY